MQILLLRLRHFPETYQEILDKYEYIERVIDEFRKVMRLDLIQILHTNPSSEMNAHFHIHLQMYPNLHIQYCNQVLVHLLMYRLSSVGHSEDEWFDDERMRYKFL